MNYKDKSIFKWQITLLQEEIIDYLLSNNYKIIKHKQTWSAIEFWLEKENVEFDIKIYNDNNSQQNLKYYTKLIEQISHDKKELKKLKEANHEK